MKYLLLFFFVACGKHETPPFKDTFDVDGDGVENHLESDEDKFISQNRSSELKGNISFTTDQKYEFSLSNNFQIHDAIMKSFYFSNSSLPFGFEKFRLWINHKTNLVPKLNDVNFVSLYLMGPSKNIRSIVLIKNGQIIKNEKYRSHINLELNREELTDLLYGKSFFWLQDEEKVSHFERVTKFDDLKNKTYRVFIKDYSQDRLFYVSKELSIHDFLRSKGINETISFPKIDLFFEKEKSIIKSWWLQKNNNDYLVINSTLDELRAEYLRFFKRKDFRLKVQNNQIVENNLEEGFHYAKIRIKVKKHQLKTITRYETQRQGTGGINGDRYDIDCKNTYRIIEATADRYLGIDEILSFISPPYFHLMGSDETGPYLKIEFSPSLRPIEILKNLTNQPQELIGPISSQCNMSQFNFTEKRRNIFSLENLDFFIETYVEPEPDFTLQY